ncbi:MAG: hypothetical protein ACU0DI_05955 [Paracoccaceae bacterium]
MSGNAMEEGLILQIHNPSHTDPSRVGFLAGALSGFAFLVALSAVLPTLPLILQIYFGLAVAAAVGTIVTLRITASRADRAADKLIERRRMLAHETARKIAEMKAGKVG